MMEVLFQTLSPTILYDFLYEVSEIITFCHVTYKLLENLENPSSMANISKILDIPIVVTYPNRK